MVTFQLEKILNYCENNYTDEYEKEYIASKIHKLFFANNIEDYKIEILVKRKMFTIEIVFNNKIYTKSWKVKREC